jgi:large subunit ribosomal protein L23
MKSKAKKVAAVEARAFHYDLIVSPVITEKSNRLSEQNKVLFNVRLEATKPDIKAAVEALFNVKVESVNTLRRLGKIRRFKNTTGKLSDTKKAIVTLPAGETIDFYSNI